MDTAAVALRSFESAVSGCVACGLSASRTRVVVGEGRAGASLLVVGEAPGFAEDRGAGPFAGEAGALLERLLAGVGLAADDVYMTTLLKCRPPQTRDPSPEEIAACEPHLFRQIELVRPRIVATLGTIATRVLSGRPHPITEIHGRPQELVCGGARVTLLPLYHPAVAVYTPAMLRTLEEDVASIPALLGRSAAVGMPADPGQPLDEVAPAAAGPVPSPGETPSLQLGLF